MLYKSTYSKWFVHTVPNLNGIVSFLEKNKNPKNFHKEFCGSLIGTSHTDRLYETFHPYGLKFKKVTVSKFFPIDVWSELDQTSGKRTRSNRREKVSASVGMIQCFNETHKSCSDYDKYFHYNELWCSFGAEVEAVIINTTHDNYSVEEADAIVAWASSHNIPAMFIYIKQRGEFQGHFYFLEMTEYLKIKEEDAQVKEGACEPLFEI